VNAAQSLASLYSAPSLPAEPRCHAICCYASSPTQHAVYVVPCGTVPDVQTLLTPFVAEIRSGIALTGHSPAVVPQHLTAAPRVGHPAADPPTGTHMRKAALLAAALTELPFETARTTHSLAAPTGKTSDCIVWENSCPAANQKL